MSQTAVQEDTRVLQVSTVSDPLAALSRGMGVGGYRRHSPAETGHKSWLGAMRA